MVVLTLQLLGVPFEHEEITVLAAAKRVRTRNILLLLVTKSVTDDFIGSHVSRSNWMLAR